MGMAIEVCCGDVSAPQYRGETCCLSVECDFRGAALPGDAASAVLCGGDGDIFLGLYGRRGTYFGFCGDY